MLGKQLASSPVDVTHGNKQTSLFLYFSVVIVSLSIINMIQKYKKTINWTLRYRSMSSSKSFFIFLSHMLKAEAHQQLRPWHSKTQQNTGQFVKVRFTFN